ncbi:MAG: M64 family metallopeptidase [Bacteroidota bacterium]
MKKILFSTIFLIFLGTTVLGQVFPVDTLFKNGDVDKRINLVFLSDGYQAHELGQYLSDVNAILNDLFSQSPFKEYKNYFNAFAVKVPSAQSGARHDQISADNECAGVPVSQVSTYFGSSFDAYGIHRLLVPTNTSAVSNVLASSFPQYDQPFVVVNSPYYGGSGGFYATSSTHANANEVSIHEIGHSFAFLADEYWAGPSYAAEKPNLTQQSNPQLVRWKNWLTTNGINIYPHAESPTWYRPHQDCKMRYLGVPFCSVCRETFVERIHTLVPPLESAQPDPGHLGSVSIDLPFSLSLIKPSPNTLKVVWKVNGYTVAKNKDQITVSLGQLTTGENKILAEIIDTTALTRQNAHYVDHLYLLEWKLDNNLVTGIEISSTTTAFNFSSYPNPADEFINFSYTLSDKAHVTINILDAAGRKINTIVRSWQYPGAYDYHLSTHETGIQKSGLYLLRINIDGTIITRKIVRP